MHLLHCTTDRDGLNLVKVFLILILIRISVFPLGMILSHKIQSLVRTALDSQTSTRDCFTMKAINVICFLVANFVKSDNSIALTCTAEGFSITLSDDAKFPNPNSSGNNKIIIGSCEFILQTTSETIQAGLSIIIDQKIEFSRPFLFEPAS